MNKEIDQIIAAKINGTATDLQKESLNEWVKSDPMNEEVYNHITSFLSAKYNDAEIINEEDVRDRIWQKSHKHPTKKTRILLYSGVFKVAAAVLILIASSLVVFNFVSNENSNNSQNKISLIEKETLPGVKSTIQLPDGSKVVLNSSSKITFLEKFSDSVRWVNLEGEAYFDVAKNPDKPFIVRSGNILTRAIGTSFNIKSHLTDVDVSLVEGVVAVRSIAALNKEQGVILNPGEYISYKRNEFNSTGNFNVKDIIGWKDGLLVFRSADYETVVKKLENWYGVQISSKGSIPNWKLNGTYDNDNLENILKTLSHSQGFKYDINGNDVKINL